MTSENRIPVDQATRDLVGAEIARNMCVEAGAGTGKTTIMVDRIVEIIRTGYARIDEMVIITFTEKAAAELATRVRESLERALRESVDAQERGRFDGALKDIYRARIETIHAFASSLLRERPVEARLDPNFEVLDTLRADLGFDEQFRTWINAYLGGDEDAEHDTSPFRTALNRGLGIGDLRTLCDVVHGRRYILPLEAPIVEDPDVFGFREHLRAEADELRALLSSVADPSDKGVPQIHRVLSFAERCDRAGNDRERLERVILAGSTTNANAGANGNWDPSSHNAEQKRIRKELNQGLAEIQRELKSSALCAILPLAEEFTRTYEQERRDAGQAEFEDLLIWARDLLRDEPHVRRDFQDRFRCLLVDEFQDTDPLQVEIVMYLASDGQSERDWTKLQPTPGKLFVVGDPKQSIYRFRRADISIYEQVKQEILPESVEVISQNFRSSPEVIDWVNVAFSNLIVPEDRIQPDYIPLDPFLTSPGLETSPVVAVYSPEPVDLADDVRQEEARLLAATIRQAVEQEWPVRDEAGCEMRPARFGDVAVLLPSRTGLNFYEDALAAAAIPFRHEGGKEYFQRQEIRDLRACLRAIDNPGDELSIVAALRSGAFGCSDQQIFDWVQAHPETRFDYRTAEPDPADAVADGLATLRSLHERRVRRSLPEIVEETIEQTNLVEFALTMPNGGDQSAANLLKMVDQARAFSAASGGGLRAFVRWTVTSSETRSDESDASVAEATDDVVRVMTIHAAKGLEFPIVALANLNSNRGGGGRQSARVVPNYPERKLEIRIGGKGNSYETPGFEAASEFEKAHEDAERLRLLYVATTRAADYLVLPMAAAKPGGLLENVGEYLPPFNEETCGRDVDGVHVLDSFQLPPADVAPRQRETPVTPEEIDDAKRARDALRARRSGLVALGNSQLRVVTASSQKAWDHADGADADASMADVRVERSLALRIGNALHRAMEQIDLSRHTGVDDAVRQLVNSVLDEPDIRVAGEQPRQRVHRMVARALESDLVARARRSNERGELAREVEFGYGMPDGGLIEGQMDLVFIEDDEVVVGDFKSDNVRAEEALARMETHYRGQAAVYAYAAREVIGLPVREVVFYFAEPGVEVRLAGDELIDLGRELAFGESGELGTEPVDAEAGLAED